MESYNEDDAMLWQWLSKIVAADAEVKPSVKINGDRVVMHCRDAYFAFDAADCFPTHSRYGIDIFVGDRLCFSSPTNLSKETKTMIPQSSMILQSTWARANAKWLEFEPTRNTVSVYSTNADTGYRCLDMIAYLGLSNGAEGKRILAIDAEKQINKPVVLDEKLVPDVAPDALKRAQTIGEYKKALINKTMQSGHTEIYDYSMAWAPPNGVSRIWHKRLVAIPVSSEEVVILTQSQDPAQQGYWLAVKDSVL